MHKLKEKKLAMSVVILFNQAKPVSEGLDLADFLKLRLVKLAKSHQDLTLFVNVFARHKCHLKCIPELARLPNVNSESRG